MPSKGTLEMNQNVKRAIALMAVPAVIVAGKTILDKLAGEPSVQSGGVAVPKPSGEEAPLGGNVSRELLDILVCPEDKGPLELVEEGKYLLNPRNGYRYPIRDGIPIMLIEEGKANRVPV
jgi:uncharacterized protein YbaR (Trm112 family)